ncbi:MAG TPA: anaerobic ribonucleoside-triphosphate reductase activating protein [Thermosulfidibacter takaii]|uniref:Anaerobic ribonucleoside-triphosphate reductase activating protein n=1 Tax=Thermosulfidibacter takaii TaxID=412593 RepID=A0A7C0Y8G7_9BACT|nr:anaerobic ribonucleoside-triphosphate reductase activating protein [Thermosulfidibacter takaii]
MTGSYPSGDGWGIRGFQGVSLLDFPGRVASLIFLGGCTCRCPFCHNPSLVLPRLLSLGDELPISQVMSDVARRMKLITGVVISGGEPTLQEDLLLELLKEAKALGLATKLDTNGFRPRVLEKVLDEGLVDVVAMDIKTSPLRYPVATGGRDFGPVAESLEILKNKASHCILRTTLVPGVVDLEDMEEIASLAQGASEYHLQPFSSRVTLDPQYEGMSAYPPHVMEEMARVLEKEGLAVVRLW